ncbi:MAG: diaminopimelate epimerase [Frankiaceae bacterium]|nr:diaminopimelate epimerase [Frankiaceae bacterium]
MVKGHGTRNDFVVLPDYDGALDLTADLVRRLCDRRAGIGGDGVLRVVRSAAVPGLGADAAATEWFMDYRNADGSVAEMCGNGVRVYARFLVTEGLAAPGPIRLATRGGVKEVVAPVSGDVTVDMGPAAVGESQVMVSAGSGEWPALPVDMGNPHAVAFVEELTAVGDLREPPKVTPGEAFPQGVNVEFAVVTGRGELVMRVHERGVGETQSCGTGACAVVVAARRRDATAPRVWLVHVPGGEVTVTEREDGHLLLRGPAVLVADVELSADWLAGRTG